MFLIMFLISSSSFSIYSLFLFCLLYSIILFHSIFFFLPYSLFFRSCSFNLLIPFYGSSQPRLLLLLLLCSTADTVFKNMSLFSQKDLSHSKMLSYNYFYSLLSFFSRIPSSHSFILFIFFSFPNYFLIILLFLFDCFILTFLTLIVFWLFVYSLFHNL